MATIKTALLSYGMSGKVFHAPFVDAHEGFELKGSWERSEKRIQKDYPVSRSYASMDEVLSDPEVDLVVINTPTYTHFEYAKKALEANKHVVVEKAFTTTVAEALALKELSENRKRSLSVFQNRRWDSDFKTVKSIVDQGLLGTVVDASISFLRFKAELSPKSHKEAPGPGAGLLKDLGAHVIDQALCLFGMPEAVFADIDILRPDSEVDDYLDILLKYPGRHVHVKSGYFFREPSPQFQVHGTRGSFLKTRADVQEDQLIAGLRPGSKGYGIEPEDQSGVLHTEMEGRIVRKKIGTLPGNYLDFYEDVYQSIANDRKPPVTATEGVQVMQVIEAAIKSNETQQVIRLTDH